MIAALIVASFAVLPASAGAYSWQAQPAWIANTGVYRQHEFVYQDYLYDDHGANTDGQDHFDLPFGTAGFDPRNPTEPRFSPAPITNWAGDFFYASPDGTHLDNVADLTEFRVAADAHAVHYRIRLADMTAKDSSVVGICVNEDGQTATGVQAWPDGAKLTDRLGCDHLYTVYGTGVDVTTPSGTQSLSTLGGSVSADPKQGYLEVTVPRSVADPGKGTWRYYVASGIWTAATHSWATPNPIPQQVGAPVTTGGAPNVPNVWDLLSNNGEPNSTWDEEKQANDLTGQSLLTDYLDVNFGRLASSANDADPKRTGVIERIYVSHHPTTTGRGLDIDRSLGTHLLYQAPWQPYVLALPRDYYTQPKKLFGFDECLHPLGGNHNVEVYYSAALAKAGYNPLVTGATPNTGYLGFQPFTQLIDRLEAVYACTLGRGEGLGYTGGDGLVDALEVRADVRAHYRTDTERNFIHGVSLGAIGTWYVARLYPDRYAAAMPYIFSTGVTGGITTDPLLANLLNLPVFFSIGTADEFGQGTQGDPEADQLEREGDQYVFLHYLGRQHEGRIENDFLPFTEKLAYSLSRVKNPARVRFLFDPSKYSPKIPGDGSAYWVSGMTPRQQGGTAKVDTTSLARADKLPTDQVVFNGLYDNTEKGFQARMRGLMRVTPQQFAKIWRPADFEHGWQQLSLDVKHTTFPRQAVSNSFTLTGTGLADVTLATAGMGIDTRQVTTGRISGDGPQALTLRGPWTRREKVRLDGALVAARFGSRTLAVTVPAGNHLLEIAPPPSCLDRRKWRFRLHHSRHARVVKVEVFVNGHRKLTRRGHSLGSVTLKRLPARTFRVRIVTTQSNGRKTISVRTYTNCVKGRPSTRSLR
ncbi:MAG: hypothetical protein QOK25_2866 [Thermoleophilaceae bacterium]|nr:hypothetical protein [Thermoleophilaceae bacterium]